MPRHWSRFLVLGLALAATGARPAVADDDDRRKNYDKYRKEAAKQFDRQRRDWEKHEQDRQRKLADQYRDDLKRQEEWQRRANRDQRNQFADTLRRQIPNDFAPPQRGYVAALPPLPFGVGGAPQDAGRGARQAILSSVPALLRGMNTLGPGADPRQRNMTVQLTQHAQRLVQLAQNNADPAALRQEYAAFAGDWGQVSPAINQAAQNPATRDQAWELMLAEQQMRTAVGYDARQQPDWGAAASITQALRDRLHRLDDALQRGGRADPNLIYDARNAAREAQTLEELVARRPAGDELRAQHDYFAAAFGRLAGAGRNAPLAGPDAGLIPEIAELDREFGVVIGLTPIVPDNSRALIDCAGDLRVSADRMRREMWAVVGSADPQLVDFYLRPVDDFSSRCDLVYKMLSEGTPPEQVRAGWPTILESGKVMGQRVDTLDRTQFASVHQLAGETAKLFGQMEQLLGVPPPGQAPNPPGGFFPGQ